MDELRQFYKSRVSKPNLFTYDDDGNLVERDKEGGVVHTITLPLYRKPTMEEFNEMEQRRLEEISVSSKKLEDARNKLHDEFQKPLSDRNETTLLRLNREVAKADSILQRIRFPLKRISKEADVKIKLIDFNQPGETRVFSYPIAMVENCPFNLQDLYVRIGEAPPKPLISVKEAKEMANTKKPIILFSNTDTDEYGFLSLKWAVEIEFQSTVYQSAKQAVYAELAKLFGDQPNLEKIMSSETADEITYSVKNISSENESKWNEAMKKLIYDVNLAKFNQYSELSGRLIETQNAILGAYEPNDTLIGIGIAPENPLAKNPINWAGQNILGKALMEIRETLKKQRETELKLKEENASRKNKSLKKPKVNNQVKKEEPPQPISIQPTSSYIPLSQRESKIPSIAIAPKKNTTVKKSKPTMVTSVAAAASATAAAEDSKENVAEPLVIRSKKNFDNILFNYDPLRNTDDYINQVKNQPGFSKLLTNFTNPSMTELKQLIADGAGDQAILEYMKEKTPDKKEDDPESIVKKDRSTTHKSRDIFSYIQTYLNSKVPPVVVRKYLDIGCSDGLLTVKIGKLLKLKPDQIYGIDIPEFASEPIKPIKGFQFTQYSANDVKLPFADNTFDLITMLQVLHHVKNPHEMLMEIKRILKPNGILFLREHDRDNKQMDMLIHLQHLFYSQISHKVDYDKYMNTKFERYFSKEAFESLMNGIGFTKIMDEKLPVKTNPTNIYYIMFINKK